LAVPNVGEIQRHESLLDINNGGGRPEKFKNDALPYILLLRTEKENMISRINRE
jgi:hypothetical protein